MNRKVSLIIQVIFWLLFFTSSAFAQSHSPLRLARIPIPLIPIIIALICYGTRKSAMGGGLLFYYMVLYTRTLFLLILIVMTSLRDFSFFHEHILIDLVGLNWIAEAFIASLLLAKRFRNPSTVNLLRVVLVFTIIVGIPALAIDREAAEELGASGIATLFFFWPGIWLYYFSFSRRVQYVLRENKGESWASTFAKNKKPNEEEKQPKL